jgi:hypothetical protein
MYTVSLPGAVAGLRGTGAADHGPRDTGERPYMTGAFATSHKGTLQSSDAVVSKKSSGFSGL